MRGSWNGPHPSLFVEPGQRFGSLVVISADARAGVTPAKPKGWRAAICQCDCGQTATVKIAKLLSGASKTCGLKCEYSPGKMSARSPEGRARAAGLTRSLSPEQEARRRSGFVRHGFASNPLYRIWRGILLRCENPATGGYHNYGGRGIQVCDRWHDVAMFVADIESSIGPRPEGRYPGGKSLYSLDRTDNDGDYEPGNVRWATQKEQLANRRSTLMLTCPECSHIAPAGDFGAAGIKLNR